MMFHILKYDIILNKKTKFDFFYSYFFKKKLTINHKKIKKINELNNESYLS